MKKQIMLYAFLSATLFASSQSAFHGTWEGRMNAGVELRMILHNFRLS